MNETHLIACIRACYPSLLIRDARPIEGEGQLNETLLINGDIIFRFPRSAQIAASLQRAIVLLDRIRFVLPLPVPRFVYGDAEARCGERIFAGYPRLPGRPLWPDDLDAIRDDAVLNTLARQLAHFLQALHSIPVRDVASEFVLANADGPAFWAELLEDFRAHLFPHMRADARLAIVAAFDGAFGAPEQFDYAPTLRHGDFGAGNILFDPHTQSVSGIIDFDSLGLGDPAVDAGAIHASYGEAFFARMCEVYPQLEAMRGRFSFYQSTYALQEALHGLRDGVQESFESGIAGYR